MTTSRSASAGGVIDVLEQRQRLRPPPSGVMRPISTRPCIDLGDRRDALLQGRGHAVEHDGRHAAADVRPGDARAHEAGADDADLLHLARLARDASATPGSFCRRCVMKNTAIRLREIGLPTSGTNASVSAFSPSSSGRLHPFSMASSAASGAG